MSKREAREKASTYFKQFGLEGTKTQYPIQLSGGMRQRAALLRSYLFSSKLMLLDEPFSALDAITKHHIHDWYLEIMKEMRSPTLFITHDIDEAASAHRIILLNDGKINEIGTPSEIFAHGTDLLRLGLDVPYSERLKDALIQRGVTMPEAYLDNERLVDYLWTLHSTM